MYLGVMLTFPLNAIYIQPCGFGEIPFRNLNMEDNFKTFCESFLSNINTKQFTFDIVSAAFHSSHLSHIFH